MNERLYSQVEEEYGNVMYSYVTQVTHAGRLYKKYKMLRQWQLILSAVSAGGFIGTLVVDKVLVAWSGAIFSTALLALTAYFKDNDFADSYKKHLAASKKLWMIKELYLSLLVDFDLLDESEIIAKRDDLQARLFKVYEEAPLTDAKSYSIAQEQLKQKGAQFFSRDELNLILPESLRK